MHDAVTPHDPLSFNHLMGGLKRRTFIIFSFMILAFVTSVFLSANIPHQYEARALIQIQVPEQNLSGDTNAVIIQQAIAPPESLVLTEVESLRSRDLIIDVVHDLDLGQENAFWNKSRIRNDAYAVDYILDHLTVRPVGRSVVLAVEYRHSNPAIAERITNRIIQIYQEKQVAEKISNVKKTNTWLEERLEILSNKLRDSARAVEEYRAKADLIDGAKVELTSQQISEISSQLIMAQADLASAKAKETQLTKLAADNKALDSVADVSKSQLVALLKRDESVLLRRQADLRSRYGSQHPRILAVNAELSELRAKKNSEILRITETMNHEVLAAQAKVDTLQQNLTDLESKRRLENQAAIGLRELQRESEANRILYENFLNRYKESGEGSLFQRADAKIIAAATQPTQPAGPPRPLIVLFVTFLGLIIGLLIALFLEFLENYIRTPAQITLLNPHARIIGMVPETKDKNALTNSLGFIHQSILNETSNTKNLVIGITSSIPDEGKTFLAQHLAENLSQAYPGRVLLIDANIYQASNSTQTIQDIVQSNHAVQELVQYKNGFSFIPTSKESHGSVLKLTSTDIQSFIEKCKASFDVILFDLDPFLTTNESVLFLKNMDINIYAVRWDFLPTSILKTALTQLAFFKIPAPCFVITRVKRHIHKLYKYSDISHLNQDKN